MRTRTTARFGVVALAFIASACSDPVGPSGARPPASPQARRALRGLDREFAQIARTVPGFGGLSRAPDGSAVLHLTDPNQAAAAKQAIAARPALFRGVDVSRIQVRPAKFDYVRLTDWRTRIRESADLPRFVYPRYRRVEQSPAHWCGEGNVARALRIGDRQAQCPARCVHRRGRGAHPIPRHAARQDSPDRGRAADRVQQCRPSAGILLRLHARVQCT